MASTLRFIIRVLLTLGCMSGAYFAADYILADVFAITHNGMYWAITIAAVILIGAIIFIISPYIIKAFEKFGTRVANRIARMSFKELAGGTLGLILGLLIANLFSSPLDSLRFGPLIMVVFSLFMGYVGLSVGVKKSEDLLSVVMRSRKEKEKNPTAKQKQYHPSILDTSVIIDGRIADIYRTGFIPGPMIVPNFVLDELKRVADSSDPLKKSRGRRGLDILNGLRQENDNAIEITEQDYEDIKEVDLKLIRLAIDMKGKIFTNDFNLNKMAQVQSVTVLNINDLANAVKTIVLPGEELVVRIIREGKEADQGVAYLDDGTMIVVENGRHYVGVTLTVTVTSVLQTAAGRMIFARPKDAH